MAPDLSTLATAVSALLGVLIGSFASIATIVIQSRYQHKREMKKMAIEAALKDFIVRAEDKSGKLKPHAVVILISFYDRIIDLISKDQLTPDAFRALMHRQESLNNVITEVSNTWSSAGSVTDRQGG